MAMFHVLNRFQKAYLHFFMLNPSFGMFAMYATSKFEKQTLVLMYYQRRERC
jgi:hypothetical protein